MNHPRTSPWIGPAAAVLLLLLPTAWADSNRSSRLEAFARACEEARRGTIAQLEHQLRGLRSEESTSARSKQHIAKIQADLRLLRENKQPFVPSLRFPPETGAIGRLPRLTCHVDQILSDREMLVRCFFPVRVGSVAHFRGRGEKITQPVAFLLRGVDTHSFQQGADVELDDVFEISNYHTYRTEDGRSTTILVLSQFDMKAVEPFLRGRSSVQR